jgi:regulation of enolase protein 1 (concanavalin A-like superfamily)
MSLTPVPSLDSPLWEWRDPPASCSQVTHLHCGCKGLVVTPAPLKDSWSRTFYQPLLLKNNAAALLATVPSDAECTLDASFGMLCINQFDQCGLFLQAGEAFVKAGLEYADKEIRLSVVVTNHGFSDWSTQSWRYDRGEGPLASSLRLRLHKLNPPQGPCILIEADTSEASEPLKWCPNEGPRARWTFVRIAPIHAEVGVPWRCGVFCAAPVAAGTVASFSHASIWPKAELSHDSDSSAMTSK